MSELKDLIFTLKEDIRNGLEKDKAKASRDNAKDDYVPEHGGYRLGAAGLKGIFGNAHSRPTFC